MARLIELKEDEMHDGGFWLYVHECSITICNVCTVLYAQVSDEATGLYDALQTIDLTHLPV